MKNLCICALLIALGLSASCKKEKSAPPVEYPATAEITLKPFEDSEPTGLDRLVNGKLYVPVKARDVNGFYYYGGVVLDDSKSAPSLIANQGFFHTASGKLSGYVRSDNIDGHLRFIVCDSFSNYARFTTGITQVQGGATLTAQWEENRGWNISKLLISKNILIGTGAVDSMGKPNLGIFAFYNIGSPAWNIRRGGSETDRAVAIAEMCDETIGVAGYTESFGHGSSDIWYMRITRFGQVLNSVYIGQQGEDEATCITMDAQCRVYIGGRTKTVSGSYYDALLVCLDKNGNELWRKTYGKPDSDESFETLTLIPGNNVVLAGGTMKPSNFIAKDTEIRAIDSDGKELWMKSYHKEGSSITPRGVLVTPEHLYIMNASYNNDRVKCYFIKDLMP